MSVFGAYNSCSFSSGYVHKILRFLVYFAHVSVEKESIEEREKRERIAKEKAAQEEAERKLKEEKATGNIADEQPKIDVVEVQSL